MLQQILVQFFGEYQLLNYFNFTIKCLYYAEDLGRRDFLHSKVEFKYFQLNLCECLITHFRGQQHSYWKIDILINVHIEKQFENNSLLSVLLFLIKQIALKIVVIERLYLYIIHEYTVIFTILLLMFCHIQSLSIY